MTSSRDISSNEYETNTMKMHIDKSQEVSSTVYKIANLTYKAVHLKQLPCLAQHLKLKSMHLNTRNNDQLLVQYPSVGTNSYGRRDFF